MSLDYSTLTINDLYHPELAHTVSILIYIHIVISTLTFSFTFYVILKKSTTEMSQYKYIILVQSIWAYLIAVIVNLWQPACVTPFILCYSMGPFRLIPFLDSSISIISTGLILFMAAGYVHSIFYGLFFRVVQILWGTPIYEYFQRTQNIIYSFVGSLLLFLIYLDSKFLSFLNQNLEQNLQKLKAQDRA